MKPRTTGPHEGSLHTFPGSRRLLMHADAGRSARAVRTLAGAADWRRELADRCGAAAVGLLGPSRCPAATTGWAWPSQSSNELLAALQHEMPGVRLVGAVVPRQPGRQRLSLLCRYAGNSIVVKLGVDEPGVSMRTEADVLSLLMINPLPGIDTPTVIAHGRLEADQDIEFLATSAIGLSAQRPAVDIALRTFEADLASRLAALPLPTVPNSKESTGASDLTPVHGDLTPWNLRRTRRGLALFDWESAGWSTAGSDLAHYRGACDEIRPWWRIRAPQ